MYGSSNGNSEGSNFTDWEIQIFFFGKVTLEDWLNSNGNRKIEIWMIIKLAVTIVDGSPMSDMKEYKLHIGLSIWQHCFLVAQIISWGERNFCWCRLPELAKAHNPKENFWWVYSNPNLLQGTMSLGFI